MRGHKFKVDALVGAVASETDLLIGADIINPLIEKKYTFGECVSGNWKNKRWTKLMNEINNHRDYRPKGYHKFDEDHKFGKNGYLNAILWINANELNQNNLTDEKINNYYDEQIIILINLLRVFEQILWGYTTGDQFARSDTVNNFPQSSW